MIQFDSVSYTYPESEQSLFKQLSFSIEQGEWVALIGPNGSGKSTLVQMMLGLRQPDTGSISIFGLDPADQEEVWEIRRRMGVVFQHVENQLVGATIEEDVAFGLENRGYAPDKMKALVEESLRKVNLWEKHNHDPHHLSGGEQQRLAIASALAIGADLLILDEATSMLDPNGRKQVLQLLRTLHREGMTIITVTHDMNEAWEAERVIILSRGELIASGPARMLLNRTQLLNEHGLTLPDTVRLRELLRALGVPLPSTLDSSEKLVEEICKLLQED